MNLIIFVLAASTALATSSPNGVRQFKKIPNDGVPRAIFKSKDICLDTEEKCWQDFLGIGAAWKGDVNDDGRDELLIYPGDGWSGSSGAWYFLFQERDRQWVSLSDGWQTRRPRFDILPLSRGGYHDLRVAVDRCVKWNGSGYVPYSPEDYHALSPAWFDSGDYQEAEIFWTIRYLGRRESKFSPQWFPIPLQEYRDAAWFTLEDEKHQTTWISIFKGGVWGVRGEKGFLIVPWPAYRASEKLEVKGDWLLIYGEDDQETGGPPLMARYDFRTHQLSQLFKTAPARQTH